MNELSSISELSGIGEKRAELFAKIGVSTVGDLIRCYPRTYDVYEKCVPVSEVSEGRVFAVRGHIYGRVYVTGTPRMQVTTLSIQDGSGTLRVVWYRMPYIKNTLSGCGEIVLRGRVTRKKNDLVMEQPEIYNPADSYLRKVSSLQPVYPLTKGLTNNQVSKAVGQALHYLDLTKDPLSTDICERNGLLSYREAVTAMHFPVDMESFSKARNRAVFEEFLLFLLALQRTKEKKDREPNHFMMDTPKEVDAFIESLPFQLTGDQKKVWGEIREDLEGEHTMSRLVQGDVGSGKTIIALIAMLTAGYNGFQSALMAPTEVLARQHYDKITAMLAKYQLPFKAILLTGSMTAAQKKAARKCIASGEADMIIGTHALIQEGVEYENLALVITDEQHRFGVKQRERLADKGFNPHILVMSATPIPRTLAMILYGDLDISVIRELPSNRLPIKNCVVDTSYRPTAFHFMEKQIAEGRQCYIICPLVEESEALEAENVNDYADMLRESLDKSIHVACLHGKMKQADKEEIMRAFAANESQILVSTTVIEVGIDVPNATVMMIENSDRFGLAQLHQLRGRVGRGAHQSYCIFMSGSKSKETKKRLEILNQSNDGFFIAGEDLKLRGPGDLFGIRQSGIMDFKVGDIYQDSEILMKANEEAKIITASDPYLEETEHKVLAERLNSYLVRIDLEKTL